MKNGYIGLLHTLDSHTGPLIYCTEEEFPIKEVFLGGKIHPRQILPDDLKQMLQSNTYDSFMKKLLHYVKIATGTNTYWNDARNNLRTIINQKGAPTTFWTLSCADFHWPEFHELSDSE